VTKFLQNSSSFLKTLLPRGGKLLNEFVYQQTAETQLLQGAFPLRRKVDFSMKNLTFRLNFTYGKNSLPLYLRINSVALWMKQKNRINKNKTEQE